MDAALASALLPLAPTLRLAGLGTRLTAAGVLDSRVLADLLQEDACEILSDLLGLGDAFTEEEFPALGDFTRKVSVGAVILKRVRASESHSDDVLEVLKAKSRKVVGEDSGPEPPPLPGVNLGLRRFGRKPDGSSTGLAATDKKERDKWNGRLAKIFSAAEAPVTEGTWRGHEAPH